MPVKPHSFRKPGETRWTRVETGNDAVTKSGWQGSMFDVGSSEGSGASLRQPMAQSVWVMRAIKIVSGPIASVPLLFSAIKRGSDGVVEDPQREAFWQNPAVGLSWHDFIEATIGWLKLAGEAFWILDDTFLRPFPEVAAPNMTKLIVARPDRMRESVRSGALLGWEWTDADGKRHALLPEQVIQIKFWNPYNPFRGLAEFDAAAIAAEADYLAGKFNLNANKNNGDRGVYVVAKGGMPSDQQQQQITQALRMKRDQAQRGIYRPMFLAGDVSIEDPKVQVPDAAFITSRLENRHEIYAGFGVPMSMADVTQSYSIGSASDRYHLIEETCIPDGGKITEAVEAVEKKRSGATLFAWLNWDEHSVMQQVRRERIDAGTKFWDRGMPWAVVSEVLDLGLKEFAGWETGYLPFNLAPVGSAELNTAPSNDPNYSEPTAPNEPGAIEAMMRVLKGEKVESQESRVKSQKEQKLWEAHMRSRKESVKIALAKFNKVLFEARAETLSKIESAASTLNAQLSTLNAQHKAGAAADFLFDLAKFTDRLLAEMRKAAQGSLQKAGEQLFSEIGKDDPFTMPPARVMTFLAQRDNRMTDVADEVFATIKGSLTEGIDAGESIAKLAERVRGSFNEISKGRATVVAMTETNTAYNFARDDAMKQAGITKKRWLTSGNPNVRASHEAANGQVVGIHEPFSVGGEDLMFPGDPSGSPENVINCHCVSIAEQGEEE